MPARPRLARLRLDHGMHLEYAEQGPRGGTTLLLLHGITDNWRSFEPVMPWLPPEWHVIALSQRGHGGSDAPADGYRPGRFAADAAALARALDLPPLVVVGHSMGAANAMRLAADHPQSVRAVVAAGAFASFHDKPDLVAFVQRDIAPLRDPVPRALAHAFQQDTLAAPVAPGLLETMVDECLRVPARVWRASFDGLLREGIGASLRRIEAPTLLIAGGADAFVPAADTERLLHELPRAQAQLWPGAGHAMHWEQPARFADAVVRFVRALPPALTPAAAPPPNRA
jgi:non-heme chloroperoxidase